MYRFLEIKIFRNILNKSKLLLKYWMPYSAIKGMCFISANGSIVNCKLRNALEVEQKKIILMS